jgi:glycine cleavage system H protein
MLARVSLPLQILHCDFPDDFYFDVENDVWLKITSLNQARVGITSVLSFLAGHIQNIKLKVEDGVDRGRSIATIESGKYFGAIRFNRRVEIEPRILNDDPYGEGWVADLDGIDQVEVERLLKGKPAAERLEDRIRELRVKCFKKLPDDQIVSIGVECSSTLVELNQILNKALPGWVVHVVTDDPFAEIEMIRWTDQTGNELIETQEEGKLTHFLVGKGRK